MTSRPPARPGKGLSPFTVKSIEWMLGKHVIWAGPAKATEEALARFEHTFELRLPASYAEMLLRFGEISLPARPKGLKLPVPFFRILGAERNTRETGHLTLGAATLRLRTADPEFPFHLVPIEDLGQDQWACIDVRNWRVVHYDLDDPEPAERLVLGETFEAYLIDALDQGAAFRELIRVVDETPSGDHLPRPHEWRAYRLATQDVLFAAAALRHDRDHNALQVGAFLTARVPQLGRFLPVRLLLIAMLTEAYKTGGSMEIRFGRSKPEWVPLDIARVAQQLGIHIDRRTQVVSAAQSRRLFIELSDLSDETKADLGRRPEEDSLPLAVCFASHGGLWSADDLTAIVSAAPDPVSLLGGSQDVAQYLLYSRDAQFARLVLLGASLDRRLKRREGRRDGSTVTDLEDDLRAVAIGFDGPRLAKRYRLPAEDVEVPWLADGTRPLAAGSSELVVLLRPFATPRMTTELPAAIDEAHGANPAGGVVAVLTTSDFHMLPEAERTGIMQRARDRGVLLMVGPDYLAQLDDEAMAHLERARTMRQ